MKKEIQHLDPFKTDKETGILGRIADALITQERLSVERFSIYNRGEALDGHHGADPFIVDANGIPKFNEDPSTKDMGASIRSLNEATKSDSGIFAELWSDNLMNSIKSNDLLISTLSNVDTLSSFGDDELGKAFKMVARLIATRQTRGVDRDLFFIPFGGWDAHKKVFWNLDRNLAYLDSAIRAFSDEMKSMGIWESTVIIQTSDFGRTLEPNSGDGSDHGW